jgi:Uma2 family endonuclease
MTTAAQTLSLEEFLKLPETKPASEFINGELTVEQVLAG